MKSGFCWKVRSEREGGRGRERKEERGKGENEEEGNGKGGREMGRRKETESKDPVM